MYTLKVLALSASGKSALCAVSKPIGKFISTVAVGSIAIGAGETVVVGEEMELGLTNISTRQSVAEDGTVFDWLILN